MKRVFFAGLRRLSCLALLLVLAAAPARLLAQPLTNQQKEFERTSPAIMRIFRQVVARPSESAVRIICKDEKWAQGKDSALGAVVEADGLIITKSSLLHGEITCKLKDGRVFPAQIVGEHEGYDLALLRIPVTGLVPVQWRPTKDIKQGAWVASVGPSAEPVAIGVVGVVTRKLKPGDQPPKMPSAKSGYMGVLLEKADGGVKIKELVPDGPAVKAGFRVDDVVTDVGSTKVADVESLQKAVKKYKPGDEATFKVIRGKESLDITMRLGKPPVLAPYENKQDLMGSELSDRRGGFPSILQHDTILLPRDCGGPLVDLDGKTVGINIARAGRTETYAVPSEAVLGLLNDLKSGKLARIEPKVVAPFKAVDVFRTTGKLAAKDPADPVRAGRFHHVHAVKLTGGAEYTIDLKSGAFDAFLRVEDAKSNRLVEDDDGGSDLNAQIVFRVPTDGEYRIVVTSYREGETGEYTLTVRQTGAVKK